MSKNRRAISITSIVLSVPQLLLGILLFASGVILSVDATAGTDAGVFLALGLLMLATGVTLISASRALLAETRQGAPEDAKSPSCPLPVAPVVPTPVDDDSQAPADKLDTNDTAATDLDAMIARSDDVVGTIRELASHPETYSGDTTSGLASMAKCLGVLEWESETPITCDCLFRNDQFWMPAARLNGKGYERQLALEAILNLCRAPEANPIATIAGIQNLEPRDSWRPPVPYPTASSIAGSLSQPHAGEWDIRLGVADWVESLPDPFRISYRFRCDLTRGTACLHIEPTPALCLAGITQDDGQREALARRVTFANCLLVARGVLDADKSHALTRLVVNATDSRTDNTLLSMELDHVRLYEAIRFADTTDPTSGKLPQAEWVRASENGGQDNTTPFFTIDDDLFTVADCLRMPDLRNEESSQAMRITCGARRLSDLALNESTARDEAFGRIVAHDYESTSDLVAALMEERAQATDPTVAEACERTSRQLVEGTIDVGDTQALRRTFCRGGSLDEATLRAAALLNGSDGERDPQAAIEIMRDALRPIDAAKTYNDDSSRVWRFFNSFSERIRYNLLNAGDAREVCLVPDAYYQAHLFIARELVLMDQIEEAQQHLERLKEIAPLSVEALMAHLRVLERQSKLYDAIELIKERLPLATSARDAALLQYRLAFFEWRLGNNELSVACYTRALAWDTEIVPMARQELEELLENEKDIKVPKNQAETARILLDNNIPLGLDAKALADMMAMARVSCDEGVFPVCCQLVVALFDATHDDALVDVHQSLVQKDGL